MDALFDSLANASGQVTEESIERRWPELDVGDSARLFAVLRRMLGPGHSGHGTPVDREEFRRFPLTRRS